MPDNLLDLERRMLGDLYTSMEVMENLETLCDDFGSRWGGSEGERLAADWLLRRLEGFGLVECRAEPFSYTSWTRGRASLRVLSPVERDLPCISLPMSPA